MSSRLAVVLPALALLVLGAAGCPPAWQKAMQRGEEARKAGDDLAAAQEFRAACATAPADSGACDAAQQSAVRAAERASASAEQSCRAGDLGVCLAKLDAARDVLAEGSQERAAVERLIDGAAAGHVERCAARPMARIDDAVARSRCVTARQAEVQLRSHDARVQDARRDIAAFLLERARALRAKAAPGAAAAHATLAGCVGGTSNATRTVLEESRARFYDDAGVLARVSVTGLSAATVDSVCARLAASTAMRCTQGRAFVTVGGRFATTDVAHTFIQQDKAIEYVAGVDRYRNPEHDRLAADIESDRRELRDLEAQAQVAKADCDSAHSRLARASYCYDCYARSQEEQICNRANALVDVHNRGVHDLNANIGALAATPAIIEQERRATHGYTETAHRWQLPFELQLDGAPGVSDAIIVDDTEAPGFAPAGLARKTARAPAARDMLATAEQRAANRIYDELVHRLHARALELSDACTAKDDDAERIDCGLRALWWGGQEPVSTWLTAVSQRVTTPWPKAACLP